LLFLKDELYLALVLSTVSHGNILEVDASAALQQAGVVDYISSGDIPGSNVTGLESDERVFATDKVQR